MSQASCLHYARYFFVEIALTSDSNSRVYISSLPAQMEIDQAMQSLLQTDGMLTKTATNSVDVPTCTALLTENLATRY